MTCYSTYLLDKYEAEIDRADAQPDEPTPCWQFEIPSTGVLDWTTDEDELNSWIQAAIKAGQYVRKTLVAPF